MKVLINGLPLFGKRLAEELNEIDPTSSYTFVDTYNSKWEQLKFLFLLPFCDCVISFNGVTDRSGSLDWVLRFKKKLIMQWMGSDVLAAMERFKNGTIERKYIDYSSNFVDSSWLREEVESLNVPVDFLNFKSVVLGDPVEKYDKIAVVSYIAQKRQLFYGMDKVVEIAKVFPDIDFHIYGMDTSDFELTPNIHLYGWVTPEVFKKAVREAPISLRLPLHDGFSVAMLESVGYGGEVIMNLPSDFTYLAKTTEEAIEGMHFLIKKIIDRGMVPNSESIRIIKERYNRSAVALNYFNKIKQIVEK